MTDAETALLEAAENLAILGGAHMDMDYAIYRLHCVCREHYPDSIMAIGLPVDDAAIRKLKMRQNDPLSYDIIYGS